MPRAARVVVPGAPHHITQRGIRRFDIFRDSGDRTDYLEVFLESCQQSRLRVLAYCLMTNHVHYVAIPDRVDSIYRVFHRAHGIYAQKFNMKYGFVGHLWQDRPFSCVLDEPHLWNAIRYVEQNPVRAAMVCRAADYPWSSAAARRGLRMDPLLEEVLLDHAGVTDWAAWLDGPLDAETVQLLRTSTFTGRPCGEDAFVRRVELVTHRDFTRKKPGRKPKTLSDSVALLGWSDDRILE